MTEAEQKHPVLQARRVSWFLKRGKELTGFRNSLDFVKVSPTSWEYHGTDLDLLYCNYRSCGLGFIGLRRGEPHE